MTALTFQLVLHGAVQRYIAFCIPFTVERDIFGTFWLLGSSQNAIFVAICAKSHQLRLTDSYSRLNSLILNN